MAAVLACLGYRRRTPARRSSATEAPAALWGYCRRMSGDSVDVAISGEAGRATTAEASACTDSRDPRAPIDSGHVLRDPGRRRPGSHDRRPAASEARARGGATPEPVAAGVPAGRHSSASLSVARRPGTDAEATSSTCFLALCAATPPARHRGERRRSAVIDGRLPLAPTSASSSKPTAIASTWAGSPSRTTSGVTFACALSAATCSASPTTRLPAKRKLVARHHPRTPSAATYVPARVHKSPLLAAA